MKNIKEILLIVLGFILVAGILYGGLKITVFFINGLVLADPKVSMPIIAAMIAAFVGITASIITQRQTKLREIDEAHRAKKVEIYQKFMFTITSMLSGNIEHLITKPPTEAELANKLFEFKQDILLWGSPKVIKSIVEMQKNSTNVNYDPLPIVDNIYKAIREDIGLSNSGLNNLELIRLFLTDPEKLDMK
ncbi:hypothetical protein BCS42_05975 [Crenothrix sp. D3]|nr:hypothetical protein BCS42_05975 [Crenothrix sp. D3]